MHACQESYRLLKVAIRRTAPNFQPFDDLELYTKAEDPGFQKQEDSDLIEPVGELTQGPVSLSDVRTVIKEYAFSSCPSVASRLCH